MLSQDTLKVAALYKALRDRFSFATTKNVTRKTRKIKPDQIQVRVHKLFARHITVKEQDEELG